MLLNLREYYRPSEAAGPGRASEGLDQVLALLATAPGRAVPLAGGNSLLASADPVVEAVVDLQGLGLDRIEVQPDRVRIGAMVTRAELAGHGAGFRKLAERDGPARELGRLGALLAETAARWAGSVQRNRATVGGAVAIAAAEDLLVLALLAARATVVLASPQGSRDVALADFLADRRRLLGEPALITDLLVTLPPGSDDEVRTGTAVASIARTPADVPIVAAMAVLRRIEDRCVGATLALGGVAEGPVIAATAGSRLEGELWNPALVAEVAGDVETSVRPAGDFRGSAQYRRAMAKVLSERALLEAWECA